MLEITKQLLRELKNRGRQLAIPAIQVYQLDRSEVNDWLEICRLSRKWHDENTGLYDRIGGIVIRYRHYLPTLCNRRRILVIKPGNTMTSLNHHLSYSSKPHNRANI